MPPLVACATVMVTVRRGRGRRRRAVQSRYWAPSPAGPPDSYSRLVARLVTTEPLRRDAPGHCSAAAAAAYRDQPKREVIIGDHRRFRRVGRRMLLTEADPDGDSVALRAKC